MVLSGTGGRRWSPVIQAAVCQTHPIARYAQALQVTPQQQAAAHEVMAELESAKIRDAPVVTEIAPKVAGFRRQFLSKLKKERR